MDWVGGLRKEDLVPLLGQEEGHVNLLRLFDDRDGALGLVGNIVEDVLVR